MKTLCHPMVQTHTLSLHCLLEAYGMMKSLLAKMLANQTIMNNLPVEEQNDEMEHMVHTPPQEPVAHEQQQE
jgi:hypothetical protein